MTVTPTSTPSPTATATVTKTYTPTVTASPTEGRWYTGNNRTNSYGVKANISTSSQPPYQAAALHSGQSSWVSISYPYWVQAGWRYYEGWTAAKRYIEWMMPNPPPGENPYDFAYHGTQPWGDITDYRVVWAGGTTWCGWIDSTQYECKETQSAPQYVQARSEIHVSDLNELDTDFFAVQYMDSSGIWHLFDQSLWVEDAPYAVDKIYYYQYYNHGP